MYWKKEIKKGQVLLSKRKFRKALKCFETAVSDCPVSSNKDLDESLFYLGVTLKKLGRDDSALRCWHIGNKLNKDGLSNEMIEQHCNSYGMSLNTCSLEDDKAAFTGIQLEKYLKMKKVGKFCSAAEKDVVKEIISSYWSDSISHEKINRLSLDNKIKFFRNQIVIFPFSHISYFENDSVVLYGDFQSGRELSMNDSCPCGSGMAFSKCCGRIKSEEELEFGDI